MYNKKLLFTAKAGIIAAVYTVLTMVSALFGLSSGVIQVRISEALSFLPFFTPAAIPGLTIGCLISNMLAGGVPLDIVFGSIATLIGAVFAYFVGKLFKKRILLGAYISTIPNVISNTLIIPFVLKMAYGVKDAIPFLMLTVGIGELIACVGLGILLITALKNKFHLLK